MRSARTDRPTTPASASPSDSTLPVLPAIRRRSNLLCCPAARLVPHLVVRVCLLSAVVSLLAACAGGSAEEARRGQARDAAATAELPERQATRVAERFFPLTPTPAPTPPPVPTLESLVITLGFAGDAPQGSYASIPADAAMSAGALLNGLFAGQVVTAAWTDGAGNNVGSTRVEITADTGRQWVALPLNGSLPPGEYAVYLFVGERRLGSLVFGVTAPGTGPQLLPDPPANPQVQPEAPAGPPNEGAGEPGRRRERDAQGQGGPAYGDPVYDPNSGEIVPVTVTP